MSYEFQIQRSNRSCLREVVEAVREELPGVTENGTSSLLLEELPDVFVVASENTDSSVSVFFAYGGSVAEIQLAFQFSFIIASLLQGVVFDPQLDQEVTESMYERAYTKWVSGNSSVLREYADGYHYVRQVIERESERIMIEAQRFDTKTAANWASVAVAFSRSGDYRRAIGCFKKARKMDPDNPDVLYSLGLTWALSGNRSRALKYLNQAIRLDPTHGPTQDLLNELRT